MLHTVRPWADGKQTDPLLAAREQWPPEDPRRRDGAALVTFAPHALSAEAVTDEARVVVDVSDEGTVVVLRLTTEQRRAVVAVLGDRRLVIPGRRR